MWLFTLTAIVVTGVSICSVNLAKVAAPTKLSLTVAQQQQQQLSEQPESATLIKTLFWGIGLGGSGLLLAYVLYRQNETRREVDRQSKQQIDQLEKLFNLTSVDSTSSSEKVISLSEGGKLDSVADDDQEATSLISELTEALQAIDKNSATNSPENTIALPNKEDKASPKPNPSSNTSSETSPSPDQSPQLELVNQLVSYTLKGKASSPEFIFRQLKQAITPDISEQFETCLTEQINSNQDALEAIQSSQKLFAGTSADLERARLIRRDKALQNVHQAWKRLQKENHAKTIVANAAQQILNAELSQSLNALVQLLDCNQTNTLTLSELQQLGELLQQTQTLSSESTPKQQEISQIASGITNGLRSYFRLEVYIVHWIYEPTKRLTEEGDGSSKSSAKVRDPWACWELHLQDSLLKELFQVLADDRSVVEFACQAPSSELSAWTELLITLQLLQRGMVSWFEKQPFDSKWGIASSSTMYLTFAVIYCHLSNGLVQTTTLDSVVGRLFAHNFFQVTLQTIRAFSRKPYFPIYGGVFALFSRDGLREALTYLNEPLQSIAGVQEKARFLTLLGYSQQAIRQYDRAREFHQQALESAQSAHDQICEIANLNHLSRVCIAQKNYAEGIAYSQRALIMARQVGDRLGEANALTNLGYSEVLSAQQLEQTDREVYETALNYLKRGLQLSKKLDDQHSQAFCYSSLGIAHLLLQEPLAAVNHLQEATRLALISGDLYLQGLSFTYLAEAHYTLNHLGQAVWAACLGMYLLEQISSGEWRQAAGILMIIRGQDAEAFHQALSEHQSKITEIIGVDGYDYLPELLEKYTQL
jgi:tetratricopeptide (TPR) repeat protein